MLIIGADDESPLFTVASLSIGPVCIKMSKSFVWLALFIFCWSSCDSKSLKDHQFVRNVEPLSERYNLEKQNEFWLNNGRKYVEKQIRREPNQKIAKNVILFLGDGMSVPTLAALRVYLGGEEKKFSFEDFEGVGMSKTYCVDGQVADSACSATGESVAGFRESAQMTIRSLIDSVFDGSERQ